MRFGEIHIREIPANRRKYTGHIYQDTSVRSFAKRTASFQTFTVSFEQIYKTSFVTKELHTPPVHFLARAFHSLEASGVDLGSSCKSINLQVAGGYRSPNFSATPLSLWNKDTRF